MKPMAWILGGESGFVDGLRAALLARGFQPASAEPAPAAARRLAESRAGVAIVTLGPVDAAGLKLVRRLKGSPETRAIPLVVLAANAGSEAWLAAIRSGAELPLAAPCPAEALASAVEALLQRRGQNGGEITVGKFSIDPDRRSLRVSGRDIPGLTPKPFELAYLLVRHRPRVLTRKQIMRWLQMDHVRDNEVNVIVHHLRRRVGEPGPRLFVTVPGAGYRFDEDAALEP